MPVPNYYNPYYYQPQMMPQAAQMPQATQMPQPTQMPQAQQIQPQQIQNGGFVSVRNEAEARAYPIAIGNSITFKDETAPYVYTKTMGFSQLDRPIFEKYRLVKEEPTESAVAMQETESGASSMSASLESLKGEIKEIWQEIDALKKRSTQKPVTQKKKEVGDDAE